VGGKRGSRESEEATCRARGLTCGRERVISWRRTLADDRLTGIHRTGGARARGNTIIPERDHDRLNNRV